MEVNYKEIHNWCQFAGIKYTFCDWIEISVDKKNQSVSKVKALGIEKNGIKQDLNFPSFPSNKKSDVSKRSARKNKILDILTLLVISVPPSSCWSKNKNNNT